MADITDEACERIHDHPEETAQRMASALTEVEYALGQANMGKRGDTQRIIDALERAREQLKQ